MWVGETSFVNNIRTIYSIIYLCAANCVYLSKMLFTFKSVIKTFPQLNLLNIIINYLTHLRHCGGLNIHDFS